MCDMIVDDVRKNLLSDRSILINKIMDDDLIETAVMQIYKFNKEDDEDFSEVKGSINQFDRIKDVKPIKIWINTPGGDLHATMSLISMIENSRTPVMTIAMGRCMSGGFLTLLAGHGRFAQKYSDVMWHDMAYGCRGKHEEHKDSMEDSIRIKKQLDDYVISKSKLTQKFLDKMYKEKRDYHFSIDELIKYKIINGVI